MNRMAGFFMKAAVIYGIIGFALGVYMGAAHEYALRSIHSHLGLLGWTTFAVCALYYQLVPSAANMTLAKVHFWAANIGLVVLAVSLVMLSRGVTAAEPGAAAGSVITFAGLAIFLFVVFSTSRNKA
ncbi:MAG: cytochrome-c oxidase [Betaproteobacteria bacterium]